MVRDRYGVELNPEGEVLGLIGSKEGCHHFILGVVNPGDVVLMTDPGYPAYRASIYMADAEPYAMPMLAQNGFFPDFDQVPPEILKRARAMFLNYPNNPTGACATRAFFSRAVEFAKGYDIAVCHDNPYSEILFDGQERLSSLAVPGAKDVGIELKDLALQTLQHDRLADRDGHGEQGDPRRPVQSERKYRLGIFNAVQYAAIVALRQEDGNIEKMLDIYLRRRKLVLETFAKIGVGFKPQKGTFYLWIPVPGGRPPSISPRLCSEKASVVVASGTAYGKHGEGYVRISLTVPDKRLEEAMERIRKNFGQ